MPLASSIRCSGPGEAGWPRSPLPHPWARSPTHCGQGASPGASSALSEWRVFCHPILSCKGSSLGPQAPCTVHRKKNALKGLSQHGTGPSCLPPHSPPSTGRPARPPSCHGPSEGRRAPGHPHAPARMQVPLCHPVGPCPSRRQPCCGRAGEWRREGTWSRARRKGSCRCPRLEPPPALGRRPAGPLSVPWRVLGVVLSQTCFGAFSVLPLLSPPHHPCGHFSLDFSCNVFTLYFGVGH